MQESTRCAAFLHFLVAILCLAGSSVAQETLTQTGPFTLNKVLDVGRNPHQISFSADGSIAYIAAAGSNQIARVRVSDLEVLPAWTAPDTPLGVIEQPPGNKLLVTHFGADMITRHDLDSGQVLDSLQTGAGPSLFSGPYPGPRDRNYLLLVAERADRLWVLDADAFEFVASYSTGKRPFPPAAASDGRKAFVPNYDDGTVTIVDLGNDEVLGTVGVGTRPSGGVVLPGDADYAVAVRGEDHLAFINTASHEVSSRLRDGIGTSPFSVVLSPDGAWGFVNNTTSHDVSAFRMSDRKVIARIPTGEIPICMAVHPSGRTLWVGCEGTHDVYVIDIPQNMQEEAEMEELCRNEVTELHRFFQEWFAGELPNTPEAFARFADVIASDFEIISPEAVSRRRAPLVESLRGAHGSDPESKIWIEDFRGRAVGTDLFQVTYEEWQGSGDSAKGRLSSALFRRSEGLPNGVEWLHLHEGWLPGK